MAKKSAVFVDPLHQTAFAVLSALILLAAFAHRLGRFEPHDAPISLIVYSPEELEQFGGAQRVVKMGLFIRSFSKFDVVGNQFVIRGALWFQFNPAVVSQETIGHYTMTEGAVTQTSEHGPHVQLLGDKLLARYDITADFSTPLNYELFPFNDHLIQMSFTNNAAVAGELVFDAVAQDLVVEADASEFGWEQVLTRVRSGYSQVDLAQDDAATRVYYPQTVFALGFRQISLGNSLVVVLPLVLLFFTALFCFSVSNDPATTIPMAAATVAAMIGQRFVIQSMAPKVGYFMLSDYLYLLYFLAVFAVFCTTFFMQSLSSRVQYAIVLALHTIVTGLTVYLVW